MVTQSCVKDILYNNVCGLISDKFNKKFGDYSNSIKKDISGRGLSGKHSTLHGRD